MARAWHSARPPRWRGSRRQHRWPPGLRRGSRASAAAAAPARGAPPPGLGRGLCRGRRTFVGRGLGGFGLAIARLCVAGLGVARLCVAGRVERHVGVVAVESGGREVEAAERSRRRFIDRCRLGRRIRRSGSLRSRDSSRLGSNAASITSLDWTASPGEAVSCSMVSSVGRFHQGLTIYLHEPSRARPRGQSELPIGGRANGVTGEGACGTLAGAQLERLDPAL